MGTAWNGTQAALEKETISRNASYRSHTAAPIYKRNWGGGGHMRSLTGKWGNSRLNTSCQYAKPKLMPRFLSEQGRATTEPQSTRNSYAQSSSCPVILSSPFSPGQCHFNVGVGESMWGSFSRHFDKKNPGIVEGAHRRRSTLSASSHHSK